MKDFFVGLSLLVCILALIATALYAYQAGHDNGSLEMIFKIIGSKGKQT